MGLFFADRKRPAPSDNPETTPVEILINIIAGYISPRTRQIRAEQAEGNPAERQTEQRRIAREAAFYGQGMPVAGHGEPEPKNNPTLSPRRRPRMVP